MGNSAYWGFDPRDELKRYGHRIGNIHIKDCTPQDYSVPLGNGDVDFDLIFGLLQKIDYKGDFILQTARGDDDLLLAEQYYKFTNQYVQEYFQ